MSGGNSGFGRGIPVKRDFMPGQFRNMFFDKPQLQGKEAASPEAPLRTPFGAPTGTPAPSKISSRQTHLVERNYRQRKLSIEHLARVQWRRFMRNSQTPDRLRFRGNTVFRNFDPFFLLIFLYKKQFFIVNFKGNPLKNPIFLGFFQVLGKHQFHFFSIIKSHILRLLAFSKTASGLK